VPTARSGSLADDHVDMVRRAAALLDGLRHGRSSADDELDEHEETPWHYVDKSVRALEKDITSWIAAWNESPRPYVWTKTADEIPESLASYCRKVTGYIPVNLIQPEENLTTPPATYTAD